jgi:hypothetical protein
MVRVTQRLEQKINIKINKKPANNSHGTRDHTAALQ